MLLELLNFSASYANKSILSDISICLQEREFLSVLGPNGSGKTTLLRSLIGAVSWQAQKAELCGSKLKGLKPRLKAKYLGYVPQKFILVASLTVEEFVLMGLYPELGKFTAINADTHARVAKVLDVLSLSAYKTRLVASLSGGEAQRVQIAAALVHQPKILLLDEPTASMDIKQERCLHELLKKLCCDLKLAVIAVTHDLNSSALVADKALVLSNGQQAFFGSASAVNNPELIKQVYGASPLFVQHPQAAAKMIVPNVYV